MMTTQPSPTPQRDIYSVSRLTTEVRYALEQGFPLLWVRGEIGNLSTPGSGHLYFTLKDSVAQVRCALFRAKRNLLRFQPKVGDDVVVRARISLYEPRGEFQLIIEQMEPAGEGALLQALEALKQRLAAEGLFDQQRKKTLPNLPQRIGLLSSPSGAAVHDVLTVLKRRFPLTEVLIHPIPVQGTQAPPEIVAALRQADQRGDCDLLILTRGGGSLEDLMAFNDEAVVRTLASLNTPVISAIGHEIDFTLADLAADQRAPTPSAAAEMAVPDQAELLQRINIAHSRLQHRFTQHITSARQRLENLHKRLQLSHPTRRLQQRQQQVDELQQQLLRQLTLNLYQRDNRLQLLKQRLESWNPALRLQQQQQRLNGLAIRLEQGWRSQLKQRQHQLALYARQLHTISPLATLDRGYAIAWKLPERELLRDAVQVKSGERIEVRLARGKVSAVVE